MVRASRGGCVLQVCSGSTAWPIPHWRRQSAGYDASSPACRLRRSGWIITTPSRRGRMSPSPAHFDSVRLIVNIVVPVICARSWRVITTSTPSRLCLPTVMKSLIKISASRLGTRSLANSRNRSSSSRRRWARTLPRVDLNPRISRNEHLEEVGIPDKSLGPLHRTRRTAVVSPIGIRMHP